MELKKLQDKQLEILKEVHEVCKKLDIRYTLSSGSALGAVRHQGFIPWDDDIDIAMTRKDYDKFISSGSKIMRSKYFIQTYQTDPQYPHIFAKVRDNETTLIEKSTQNLSINHGVYIDIFPIDKVSNNKLLRIIDKYTLSFLNLVKFSTDKEYCKISKSKKSRYIRLLIYPFARIIGTQRLCKIEDRVRTKYNRNDLCKTTYADSGQVSPPHRLTDKRLMDIDIFNKVREVLFENEKFYLIEEYDRYLNTTYGEYMKLPPVEKRISHHDIISLDLDKSYKVIQ